MASSMPLARLAQSVFASSRKNLFTAHGSTPIQCFTPFRPRAFPARPTGVGFHTSASRKFKFKTIEEAKSRYRSGVFFLPFAESSLTVLLTGVAIFMESRASLSHVGYRINVLFPGGKSQDGAGKDCRDVEGCWKAKSRRAVEFSRSRREG